MKRYVLTAALTLGLVTLAACQKSAEQAAAPAADTSTTAVATVDGKPISSELFDAFSKARARKPTSELTEEQRKELLEQMINLQITADAATKAGLDKQPETAARVEISRLNVLADAALENHLKGKEPTEQELRAEYETQVAALPKLEYRARHILVATEAFATAIIDKLRKGGDFAEIARKESMDSKENGGELGWFSPARMVPEFSAAVTSLKKGEITQKPVQTQYGWHVIQLEDTREVAAPDYEEVKSRLGQIVQNKKLQAYLDELKKTVKIEEKT
jgi:peptidyl-prolyl cis-trans isomerase C